MTEFRDADPRAEEPVVDGWRIEPFTPAGFVLAILELVLRTIGAAAVRRHVDVWEAARHRADEAEDAKFGREP